MNANDDARRLHNRTEKRVANRHIKKSQIEQLQQEVSTLVDKFESLDMSVEDFMAILQQHQQQQVEEPQQDARQQDIDAYNQYKGI